MIILIDDDDDDNKTRLGGVAEKSRNKQSFEWRIPFQNESS